MQTKYYANLFPLNCKMGSTATTRPAIRLIKNFGGTNSITITLQYDKRFVFEDKQILSDLALIYLPITAPFY
jgi:hypothetical protein